MIGLWVIICLMGVGCVLLAAYAFFLEVFMMAAGLYVCACILLIFAYKGFLYRAFPPMNGLFYALLGGLCLFIPLFGIIISLLIVLLMLDGRWKIHPFAYRGDEAINLDQIHPYHSNYGAGGVILHLFQDNAPIKDRSAALFALRESPLSQINPLIHELLPDTSDDIRLLAFNILEGQESSIMSRIESLLLKLKTVPDDEPLIQAQCQKSLALSHWELIHHHLIAIELEETIINKAIASALSALAVLSDDAVLWALLGKLYQHRQQDLLAVESFETALSFHSAPTEVFPYLAEIRFKQGDYSAIQALLNRSDALLDMMQIAPVKRFWGLVDDI